MYLNLNNKEKDILLKMLEGEENDALAKKIRKSMTSIKPRSAKNKGLSFQKRIAVFIGDLIGIKASQDDDSLIQSRLSGQNGTDIILRGEAKTRFPYSVECKDCDRISLPEWVEQARQNSTEDSPWLLFIHSRPAGQKDLVVMEVETFRNILAERGVSR